MALEEKESRRIMALEEKESRSIMEEVQWKREEMLGAGGFGTVFRARAITTTVENSWIPSLMAVKTAELSKSDSLHEEATILSSLQLQAHLRRGVFSCPYIIGYYGHDTSIESDQREYFNIFLEYACHGSLRDKIRRSSGGLPEPLVKFYTRSIARGLDHIHRHGYVHCDVKPDNILLASSSGGSDLIVPKIADFGLAMSAGTQSKRDKGDKVRLRGTPSYMAPESIRFNEFEPHSDVWALGCVVLEMLTGKLAWRSPPSSLLDSIAHTEELPSIPETLSEQATQFVKNCLVKDPALRWNLDMLLQHPFVSGESISLEDYDQGFKCYKHPMDLPSFDTEDGLSLSLHLDCSEAED